MGECYGVGAVLVDDVGTGLRMAGYILTLDRRWFKTDDGFESVRKALAEQLPLLAQIAEAWGPRRPGDVGDLYLRPNWRALPTPGLQSGGVRGGHLDAYRCLGEAGDDRRASLREARRGDESNDCERAGAEVLGRLTTHARTASGSARRDADTTLPWSRRGRGRARRQRGYRRWLLRQTPTLW